MIEAIVGTTILLVIMACGPTSREYARSKRHDRDPY